MQAHIYKIECLTNMHVGSGEVNYNIIDNEVQKDPVLQIPTINSSSLKGALRAHFEQLDEEKKLDDNLISYVFGSKNSNEQKDTSEGKYKFLSGNMISKPARISRTTGNYSYANITTPSMINQMISLLNALNISTLNSTSIPVPSNFELSITDKSFYVYDDKIKYIEGVKTTPYNEKIVGSNKEKLDKNIKFLKFFLGDNFAICTDAMFSFIDLPVIARNQLENGISKNLWYEEIVPHKSIFYFALLTPSSDDKIVKFNDLLNQVVQIGANASIGYGVTKITKIS